PFHQVIKLVDLFLSHESLNLLAVATKDVDHRWHAVLKLLFPGWLETILVRQNEVSERRVLLFEERQRLVHVVRVVDAQRDYHQAVLRVLFFHLNQMRELLLAWDSESPPDIDDDDFAFVGSDGFQQAVEVSLFDFDLIGGQGGNGENERS